MASNQTGIAIVIKAFLPIGKTLDEQLSALTLVKTAHETSDYSSLLAAANVDEVKTEQKTRRVEDQPAPTVDANDKEPDIAKDAPDDIETKSIQDDDVPAFLKPKKGKATTEAEAA